MTSIRKVRGQRHSRYYSLFVTYSCFNASLVECFNFTTLDWRVKGHWILCWGTKDWSIKLSSLISNSSKSSPTEAKIWFLLMSKDQAWSWREERYTFYPIMELKSLKPSDYVLLCNCIWYFNYTCNVKFNNFGRSFC